MSAVMQPLSAVIITGIKQISSSALRHKSSLAVVLEYLLSFTNLKQVFNIGVPK